jgi:hypothetical protein
MIPVPTIRRKTRKGREKTPIREMPKNARRYDRVRVVMARYSEALGALRCAQPLLKSPGTLERHSLVNKLVREDSASSTVLSPRDKQKCK